MISLLLILLSVTAEAAPRVNNGGGVWICKKFGEVEWIQAADFFEPARWTSSTRTKAVIEGLSTEQIFREKSAFVKAQVPDLAKLLAKWPVDFKKVTHWVDFPLSPTRDMNFESRPQPADCEGGDVHYAQLADFLYSDALLIDKTLWNNPKLLPIDQAAILFHEWIYKALREDRDEQTSNRTREIVAWIFSDAAPETINKEISWALSSSSHDQLKDEVATFPVAPRCEAFVDQEIRASWQSRATKFGEEVVLRADHWDFKLTTSPKDGVPEMLKIEGRDGTVSLGEGVARSSFLRIKKVSFSYTTKDGTALEIRCWNQI